SDGKTRKRPQQPTDKLPGIQSRARDAESQDHPLKRKRAMKGHRAINEQKERHEQQHEIQKRGGDVSASRRERKKKEREAEDQKRLDDQPPTAQSVCELKKNDVRKGGSAPCRLKHIREYH